jgi:hypothetical protein
MKYVLLIYSSPNAFQALPEEERRALMTEFEALNKELEESGVFVGGEGLADPVNSKTVRVRGGVPAITDGPFAEAKEQLAGYYIVDVENIDRATEIALRDPASRLWAIEVRPVMDESGLEM